MSTEKPIQPATSALQSWRGSLVWVGVIIIFLAALYQFASSGLMKEAFEPLSEPYKQLFTQYQGVTAAGEQEYVVVAAKEITPEAHDAFFKRNPDVTFQRKGVLDGTLIITLPPDAKQRAVELRKDAFVSFILTNRLGMFCH